MSQLTSAAMKTSSDLKYPRIDGQSPRMIQRIQTSQSHQEDIEHAQVYSLVVTTLVTADGRYGGGHRDAT